MEHNRIKRFNENSELNISDVSCSIRYNQKEEIIQIINQDGKVVFGGNFWDFNSDPESFKTLFESLGLKVSMHEIKGFGTEKIEDDTYKYE